MSREESEKIEIIMEWGYEKPVKQGGYHKPYTREQAKIGRNEPCPCNSGKKWKKCHGS